MRFVLFLWLALSSAAFAEEVDLELVLAMDGSGSISESEYILQLEGTARAFEDPSIQQAIVSGPIGKIAVSVMIWSDAPFRSSRAAGSCWRVLRMRMPLRPEGACVS